MNGSALSGRRLSMLVRGASHAREIGVELLNFPRGFRVDMPALKAFMERRAPGRDATSTARQEPDVPEFLSGLDANHVTTGGKIDARIVNRDRRSGDYANVKSVPRPGHSDYPVWIKTGAIPAGGGAHSGRMTAPMCIAGGICRQYLEKRGITVAASTSRTADEILAVKKDGDSIGGKITCRISGMPKGLGWAMFDGLESDIARAMFAIPGVKALSFGDGERAADMRGSEFNDGLRFDGGEVKLSTNHSGGLAGGMTNGEDMVFHVTMRPTPSIYKEQPSIDLAKGENAALQIKGRHDPCIALRAVPVVEALASFVVLDNILAEEAETPRICLVLNGKTVDEDLALLAKSRDHVDMCELRVDLLEGESERLKAAQFPQLAKMPAILTLRRRKDGGKMADDREDERAELFKKLLASGAGFAFVDFEHDFRRDELASLARAQGVKIIRSRHEFCGTVKDLPSALKELRGETDEIPKIAFMPNSPDEVTDSFREMASAMDGSGLCFPYIVCGMGALGRVTRILASHLGSMLTFCSSGMDVSLGHLTAEDLVKTYRFRSVVRGRTSVTAVTGWPLEVTSSPELNNAAFANEQEDAVMVPFPARTFDEFLRFAEVLEVKYAAVTVPHKESALSAAVCADDAAKSIGAANTLVRTENGFAAYNTDAPGFTAALCEFLGTETLKGRSVAILGAGGAAKAVAYAVRQLGGDAVIYNRTREKAEALAAKYWFKVGEMSNVAHADLIVQTTSVGLNSDADPIPGYEFRGDECVFDLVYHPKTTALMARALAAGARAENGFKMLVNQAACQRELYFAKLLEDRKQGVAAE